MNSNNNFLLPLYNVRKQTKSFGLNEKKLIILLIFSTLISFVFIIKQLPSNVTFNNKDNIRFFIPKINKSRNIIHNEHEHSHHDLIIPPPPNLDKDQPLKQIIGDPLPDQNDPSLAKNVEKDLIKNVYRREKVINMTKFAWAKYKEFAWGRNELKPLSRSGHQAGIFGAASNAGASIIDAMDTLYLMGLDDEFNEGKKWIIENFSLDVNSDLSAFEINIRFVGGFLALHTFTKEKIYLDKAAEVANLLLPIFNTPTGIPYALVNPQTKQVKNYNWAAGSCSILSEFGSLSLEFQYLSDMTGNPIYKQKIDKIFETLNKAKTENGLFYNYLNPSTGQWCSRNAGLGGLADSFYEYLLKLWLYKSKNDKDLLNLYLNTMESVDKHLIRRTSDGLTFAGEYNNGALTNKMGHLACFTGGMFALTAMYVNDLTASQKEKYENLAKEITNTCHESYIRTPTHLGPESFSMDNGREVIAMDRYYILRPEVIESYFYLWRMTKDNKYRDWAWDALEAIEKHCKTENGYTGLKDVTSIDSPKDDVQQSFFFAETLKYLYLIFSDDNIIPLDKYVFNTEAHPLLIKN